MFVFGLPYVKIQSSFHALNNLLVISQATVILHPDFFLHELFNSSERYGLHNLHIPNDCSIVFNSNKVIYLCGGKGH